MAAIVKDQNILGSLIVVIVCLSSFPALLQLARSFCSRKLQFRQVCTDNDGLVDEDDAPTRQTQKAYYAAFPSRSLLVLATSGLLLSFTSSVLGHADPSHETSHYSWILFGLWILLCMHVSAVSIEQQPCVRFRLCLWLALASTVTVILIVALLTAVPSKRLERRALHHAIVVIDMVQGLCASILILLIILSPRRPGLVIDGYAVDGQFSVALVHRLGFSWGSNILKQARNAKSLNMVDLPVLHREMRSSHLLFRFEAVKKQNALWKTIYFVHQSVFLQHYALSLLQSGAQFVPQFSLYRLLKLLELGRPASATQNHACLWAGALGLSMLIAAWLETQLLWMVWTRLVICLRSELTALIYTKVLRKKDVTSMPSAYADHSGRPNLHHRSGQSTPDDEHSKDNLLPSAIQGSNEVDRIEDQRRQNTTNLIGLDAKRVTDFVGASFLIPASALKLAISMAFLCSLIGWQSVLSGLVAMSLLIPFNIVSSRRLNEVQILVMRTRDERMSMISEALQGIRQIKFTASELQWLSRIGNKRQDELALQWRSFLLRAVLVSLWQIGPILLSAVSLAVYTILHGNLSPSVAFTTIAVFSQIEGSLAIIPKLVVEMLQARISTERIGKYLDAPEKSQYLDRGDILSMRAVSITWPVENIVEQKLFALGNLNLSFPTKMLSVISGATGSGKSLLLKAIAGEAEKISGIISIPTPTCAFQNSMDHGNWIIEDAVAYVSQSPWIENASIKENILFGLPFQRPRYEETIAACALDKDLDMLSDGDATEVGVGGVNLSGGQKWRVSFARALYSRAGVLILDDIFSAVDAHVGAHIYKNALTGSLGQHRTRIIATHHTDLCLSKATYSVRLGHGSIVYTENLNQDAQSLDESVSPSAKAAETYFEAVNDPVQKDCQSTLELSPRSLECGSGDHAHTQPLGISAPDLKALPRKFVLDEKRDAGSVKLHTYRWYLSAAGGVVMLLMVLLAHIANTGVGLGRSWWISLWTRSSTPSHTLSQAGNLILLSNVQHQFSFSKPTDNSLNPQSTNHLWFYLSIYLGLSVAICIMGVLKFLSVLVGSIRASKTLFERFSSAIFHAPIQWIDTTPTGRILNRFTADFETVDASMADGMGFFLTMFLSLIAIIFAGTVVSPYIIVVISVLLVICLHVAKLYLPAARDVKRLESVARSPIFELFESTLAGVGTIRAYGKSELYSERMMTRIDAYACTSYHRYLFNLWMILRLNVVGATFATIVAAITIVRKDIDASLAGFALSFALQYTTAVEFTIRQFSNTQLSMNSTERIMEYSQMATEEELGHAVPAAWPSNGSLAFEEVVTGYTPGEDILRGVSFKIAPMERVGVVGRTGAGKSTLTMSLFRFLETRSGNIFIDGIDVSKIRLKDLRSRLAIIPQDPVLFTGTFRSNLDPFDEHTDGELNDALKQVHLREENLNSGHEANGSRKTGDGTLLDVLSLPVGEGGQNLSQGQRQLLCLARAIVCRRKIMVMDEATSSVDMPTDALIQKSIRAGFKNSTLLVIAHRLSTVADFDKILVMSEGKVVEFDEPRALLDKRGVFWELVRRSGEKALVEQMITRGF